MPASIPRPEYVDKPAPAPFTGPEVKDSDTIERMRIAGKVAAEARDLVGSHVVPGVTTDELDRIGHEFLCDHGAYPSTLGYKGFPKSLCTSVNEVICHGIPDSTVVQDGDIVNIDITGYLNGVHGDTNATFLTPGVTQEVRDLVDRTREALRRAINAVKPGRQINVIGRVIESYAKRFGYGVVREFTGHGIGTAFHSGLVIPHFDDPHYDEVIEPGHDLHDRADAQPGDPRVGHVGRQLDRGHQGPAVQRTVRAHARWSPTTAPRSSPSPDPGMTPVPAAQRHR